MSRFAVFLAVPMTCFLVAFSAQAQTPDASADCLDNAAAQLHQADELASSRLAKDTSRCARLPSIEVKQACSDEAFSVYEAAKQAAQAEYKATVSACIH